MNQKTKSGLKIISNNRKAKFNYFFNEFFEAGIVLKGSEVKSLRDGKANISESYAFDDKGEIYLVNSHIPSYKESSYNNHDPKRNRKLLLNKRETCFGGSNLDFLSEPNAQITAPCTTYFIRNIQLLSLSRHFSMFAGHNVDPDPLAKLL